jgi:hypothetical protein
MQALLSALQVCLVRCKMNKEILEVLPSQKITYSVLTKCFKNHKHNSVYSKWRLECGRH